MSRLSVVYTCALIVLLFNRANACGAVGNGQMYTNPTINFKFHPPTAWTYPNSGAQTSLTYFQGQSMSLSEAQLVANGAMNAAALQALNAMGLPTTAVTITVTYTPPQVSDCGKSSTSGTTTPAGGQFGYEELGAITQLITSSAAVTAQNCIARNFAASGTTLTYTDFVQQAQVQLGNTVLSDYQMTMIVSQMTSTLMLNYKVDFTEEASFS